MSSVRSCLFVASCSATLCGNGGTCVLMSGGTTYKCACPASFTGDRCELAVNSECLDLVESTRRRFACRAKTGVPLNRAETVDSALKDRSHSSADVPPASKADNANWQRPSPVSFDSSYDPNNARHSMFSPVQHESLLQRRRVYRQW